MATDVIAGFDCVIEVNATGVTGGTWVPLLLARDVTVNLSRAEIDVSSRGGAGWRERIGGLKDLSIEFDMLDATADPGYVIVRVAFLTGANIGVRAINGAVFGSGGEGPLSLMQIYNFTRGEPLEDALTFNVTLMPARGATAPEWKTTV